MHLGYPKQGRRESSTGNARNGTSRKKLKGTQVQDLYGVEVSPTFISNITEAVMDEVRQWQNRPLEQVYPIVYVDCLVVKVRENQRVINKALSLALGVDLDGQKELLGMGMAHNEGAKFWLSVFDSAAEPRTQGHLHCVCGWAHRFTRSD